VPRVTTLDHVSTHGMPVTQHDRISRIRMEELHDVVAVEVVGEFRLRLSFDDGTVGEVDWHAKNVAPILAICAQAALSP
jgi:hypothetical protein